MEGRGAWRISHRREREGEIKIDGFIIKCWIIVLMKDASAWENERYLDRFEQMNHMLIGRSISNDKEEYRKS